MIRDVKLHKLDPRSPKAKLLARAGVLDPFKAEEAREVLGDLFRLEPSPAPKAKPSLRVVPRPQAEIRFTVPGNPIPWERVQATTKAKGKRGRVMLFTAPRTRRHQERIQREARLAKVRPLVGDVRLEVKFYRATAQRCDVDNLSKSVQDALNRYAYDDDSQIVVLVAEKHVDRERPRTEIRVTEA